MLVNNNLHRPLEVVLAIPVKTYDIDFMGIVSNIVYIRWLEDLRLKFLDEHWQLNQQIELGYTPILAGTEIEYKRPIKIIDRVIGRLWLSGLGRLKWTVQAEILSNNELAAVASQKGGFVSLQNNRLIPIPEELQKKYLQYQQGIQKI
ncbi:MAG: thioesterase family protein [Nostoc sp. DedQUE08]|uniref:acyl-CoA thioesterase n=1 Tax=unclassified Nostoc TaxID=2593658 RepID=UPI002AD340B7|nr:MULTISPECIES: thioesterase family protein [unclassified Nostoc]MDZ8031626.1 thioesterase family protein [Nostoc sp. DedSLP04]MDZ8066365.1 thioesterase family protein [Nostoc sp. DedQUE08]MDZ8091825.1 thioesterase family protein [Nostoc sp. DedQUE05]MDZ8138932.1 thioesterase family protein [Nostoc sp. DedQUE04]